MKAQQSNESVKDRLVPGLAASVPGEAGFEAFDKGFAASQRQRLRIAELELALASSKSDAAAAHKSIDQLTRNNARLRELSIYRENEVAKARRFVYDNQPAALSNRTLLLDWLDEALDRTKREHKQLALVLIDLSRCRAAPERLTCAGDVDSERVADLLRTCLRAGDIATHELKDGFAPSPVGNDGYSIAVTSGFDADLTRRDAPKAPGLMVRRADLCLSAGLDPEARAQVERLLLKRMRIPKGGVLYRSGDPFKALFAIHAGSCKTVLMSKSGQERVAGYHMEGATIGVDGVGNERHECQAIALEDTEACRLQFSDLERLAQQSEPFRRNLYRLLSQESLRAQTLMTTLVARRADQRLAVFLLDLASQYRPRGYSSREFVLRMSRREIGSYLGIRLETVSRLFTRFQSEGLIQVQRRGRAVKLLEPASVSELADCE
jgi:CRP/FNR family transcriptional regulator